MLSILHLLNCRFSIGLPFNALTNSSNTPVVIFLLPVKSSLDRLGEFCRKGTILRIPSIPKSFFVKSNCFTEQLFVSPLNSDDILESVMSQYTKPICFKCVLFVMYRPINSHANKSERLTNASDTGTPVRACTKRLFTPNLVTSGLLLRIAIISFLNCSEIPVSSTNASLNCSSSTTL